MDLIKIGKYIAGKRSEEGRILKRVRFNFPVKYEDGEEDEIRLLNENAAETVVLLTKTLHD